MKNLTTQISNAIMIAVKDVNDVLVFDTLKNSNTLQPVFVKVKHRR